MSLEYIDKAINPLEYSVQTGKVRRTAAVRIEPADNGTSDH